MTVTPVPTLKDLSRFGRSYIEVGNYLEQGFPFLGVRFIAANGAVIQQRRTACRNCPGV